jgi:hypothetical protein
MPIVTKEEMLDLVRAIKFAKPDASMRQVHIEITEELSKNESFEFLSQIPLTDIKKVWKKAVQESAAKRQENSGSLLPEKNDTDEHWKLYTVGNGSVQSLATEYSQATAKAAMEQQQQRHEEEQEQRSLLLDHYVHVFLNVPADRSGQRPHQALINFSENNKGAKKKGDSSKKATATSTAGNETIICKIQVAASPDGKKYPMLLYNEDRTLKTFVHPPDDEKDKDDGYNRIFHMINTQGVGGALGASGGTKAYFNAKLTPRSAGRAEGILSIDTRQLADVQSW